MSRRNSPSTVPPQRSQNAINLPPLEFIDELLHPHHDQPHQPSQPPLNYFVPFDSSVPHHLPIPTSQIPYGMMQQNFPASQESTFQVSQYTGMHTSQLHPVSHTAVPSSSREVPLDPDEIAILEDKRQRNTAASARFRIKKKQKALELERTVSDLTSRAAELEREATNLRRENTWLKEIVILKGRQNITGSAQTQNEASTQREGKLRRKDETSSSGESGDSSCEEPVKGEGKGKGRTDQK